MKTALNLILFGYTLTAELQNIAAHMVNHITPVLRSLHWLPTLKRIQFKILLLVYNQWTVPAFH
jgi:hypothetical protein